jgi:hypothetical protein
LILAQNIIIAIPILRFTGRGKIAGAFFTEIAAAIYTLLISVSLIDTKLVNYLSTEARALNIASKLPQILTACIGSDGAVKRVCSINYLTRSLNRIFTKLQ